ncbi:MAG: UDP-N-acetylmuramoyl-L-alanine--D-glutamate ligase [Clostridia bacterium]|nr:UDP-N-acetylmuramoyl-L-alanine--D-glutamate ligase [Clostridia bacterium]
MIKDLIKYLEDKKILILGFGLEGQSTYKLIRKHLKEKIIYIADKEEEFYKKQDILKNEKNAIYISGEKYLDELEEYDLIMKTPGISFANLDTTKFLSKIKSQLELLLEFFNIYTIGVTGTKGKSTTSSLIYEILKVQGIETMLLGNIGNPVFDYIDEIKEKMIVVLEMSSHQLEYMEVSPNISVLLNIYEEHLDHYKSFDNYADAKCNIFKYQTQDDYFLYNPDNEMLEKEIKKYKVNAKKYEISLEQGERENRIILKNDEVNLNGKKLYNSKEERNLLGKYNLSNIMFALTVSEILNLNLKQTVDTINTFETLPHRIELVGKYDGVIYYNDSIATIPESTINSIEALEKVNTLIIGGMDRKISFMKFIDYLNNSKIQNLICMPATGYIIGKEIKNNSMSVYMVEDLEEAVKTAKKVTKKEMICLLSPAAASYGFFKNFKERGELYRKLVTIPNL